MEPKKCFDCQAGRMYILDGFSMRTYMIYTQCDRCGVYDRDPSWCALCQRPKESRRADKAIGPPKAPRTDPQLASGVGRRP